jgi:hypothetical protein
MTAPRGLYARYLARLVEKHTAEGAPAPEICDDEYWRERRENHAASFMPPQPDLKTLRRSIARRLAAVLGLALAFCMIYAILLIR